jgi:predicted nucleotidyltransferase
MNPGEIAPLLRGYPYIAAAYQFGSTVRGRAGPLSDLDIAILVDEKRAPAAVENERATHRVAPTGDIGTNGCIFQIPIHQTHQ